LILWESGECFPRPPRSTGRDSHPSRASHPRVTPSQTDGGREVEGVPPPGTSMPFKLIPHSVARFSSVTTQQAASVCIAILGWSTSWRTSAACIDSVMRPQTAPPLIRHRRPEVAKSLSPVHLWLYPSNVHSTWDSPSCVNARPPIDGSQVCGFIEWSCHVGSRSFQKVPRRSIVALAITELDGMGGRPDGRAWRST
jgi:hypothetical protein